MRNLILSCTFVVLTACGGNSNSAAPSDPSVTNAAPSETTSAPSATTSAPTSTPTASSTSEPVPATLAPTDGKAGAGDDKCGPVATTTASTLDTCLAECEKLSNTSPQGAKCMPPRVACKSHCNTKFKK